ncbi:DNA-binding domain-containing protein [Rhizobium sp. Root1220]|uniref:HvfC/BufC N-terminal domain-containing protein n=1 Tax=Rhizobium sp. Root1220 TaxID=1736432 RepID=UPI000701B4E2|nr:DNA-binding domain-containing protein [Rhizobium sp. Root1220]KQV66349.1 hypothetical protein ASC90_14315 [Rhizobium sp. Root1220]
MPQLDVTREPAQCLAYSAEFAPALIDPDAGTPSGVVGPNGKGAVKRYNVYRNNVTVSLIDTLVGIFPAVQRLVGPDFFRAMARFHLRATPPTSPLLFQYGHDFPDFIERYEYAQSVPWLADVARIERAWLDAYHAANVGPVAAVAVASVQPERLGDLLFTVHPATRIVRSAYPALTIFAAYRSEGPTGPIETSEPEDALITRPDMEVVVRHLPPGGAEFLISLIAGKPLGLAAATAVDACPSFDIAASIAGMIESGVFCAITLGDA